MPEENNYIILIAQIKTEIETARLRASISVNQQLLILYWKIGSLIAEQQKLEGWGTKIIDRLSIDLKRTFPGMKGTSVRNLKYMRAFAEAYPDFAESITKSASDGQIVQAPLAQLTWYHHITLIDKVRDIS